jgi:JmjC domain.
MRCSYYLQLQLFTIVLLMLLQVAVAILPVDALLTIVLNDSKTEETVDDASLSCTNTTTSINNHERHDLSSSHTYCYNFNHDDCSNNTTTCTAINRSSTTSKKQWKWNLDSIHECNIERINLSDVSKRFQGSAGNNNDGLVPPLYSKPLIIHTEQGQSSHNGCLYSIFQEKTALSNITSNLPDDFYVTLSSSNSYSAHRRSIPLVQYLNETISSETLPTDLSNETWYLFGETYSNEWQRLLSDFCLPPCQTCTKDLSALAFGIGGKGSGVQWHTHGPGFSQSIHGRKHWVLYPPDQKPFYDPDFTSRHWMEEVYTRLGQPLQQQQKPQHQDKPYECTLFPGDMIYFPDKWYHATINLDQYTVFVSTFTTEHNVP